MTNTTESLTKTVAVDLTRSPRQMIEDTGRTQYVDQKVLEHAPYFPQAKAVEKIELTLFKVGRWISDDDIEKEYEARGLKPCDIFQLAALNKAEPDFAHEHPNATHWKGAEGEWCYAAFHDWDDVRNVRVNRDDGEWYGDWFFAGVRKSSALGTSEPLPLPSDTLNFEISEITINGRRYRVVE
jgi:hypothetical protein